ncbi:MAG: DNA cytosine methyltransferase [Georgfuchsia sp.]
MRFGSVCSGIEAASVAFNPLGWKAAWLAEIEPFPSAVLAHHYPTVPNLGDMTKIAAMVDAGEIEAPDLFCGGCPCQSFSVAGMRKSLGDERGNLTLEFIRIADAIDRVRRNTGKPPVWVFYENVPGILNTADNAFGSFLGGLCGDESAIDAPAGGWPGAGVVAGPSRVVAWRTLDAQFFGVAQRRKRVFVLALGGSGKWACADALLPITNSLQGHPAPSRQARQVAPTIPSRSSAGGGLGTDFDCDGGLIPAVSSTLLAQGNKTGGHRPPGTTVDTCDTLIPVPHADISSALKACDGKGPSRDGDGAILVPMLAHSLRGEGFDASEDGTGRGTPLAPIAFPAFMSATQHALTEDLAPSMGALNPTAVALNNSACSEGNSLYNQGFNIIGDSDASTQKTHSIALLRRVRNAIGEEAFAQWGLGILDSLQSPEILRSALHGSELRPATFSRCWMVCCALGSPFSRSAGAMHSMREAAGKGCASQGWEFSEQQFDELGAYLSELSQPGAQAERLMRDLWQAAEGPGLLRNALSAIQEARRPSGREGQPVCSGAQGQRTASSEGLQGAGLFGQVPREGVLQQACTTGGKGNPWSDSVNQERSGIGAMAVRRLVVEECEFLQGFPHSYTAVPHRGKPAADGNRYKALGNSWAVPNVRWIGERINAVCQLNSMDKVA